MKKYDIKISESKIIENISLEKIVNLLRSKKLRGNELCKIVHTRTWKTVLDYPEIRKLVEESEENIGDANLSEILGYRKEIIQDKKKEDIEVALKRFDLAGERKEFNYKKEETEEEEIQKETAKEEEQDEKVDSEKKEHSEKFDGSINKFHVVNIDKNDKGFEEEVSDSDKTHAINIYEVIPKVKEELGLVNNEEKKDHTGSRKIDLEEIKPKEKKKLKPIALFCLIAIFAVLLFDDNGPETPAPQKIRILFPQIYEIADKSAAKKHFLAGKKYLEENKFINYIKASKEFKKSMEHKFKDNPAIGYLIYTYALTLNDAKNPRTARNTIYNLIKIARPQLYLDETIALGTSLFYFNIDKKIAALSILKNYIRVNNERRFEDKTIKQPGVMFFSLYLKVLLENGDFSEAEEKYNLLSNLKVNSSHLTLALVDYEVSNENLEFAEKRLFNYLKLNPQDVEVLLKYGDVLIKLKKFKKLYQVSELINQLNAGGSIFYYAKWLEFQGILFAVRNKKNDAAKFFKLSLKISESENLINRLSNLEFGKEEFINKLILESKVKKNYLEAKNLLEKRQYDQAFMYAIRAVDLNINHIPSQILLSQIQTEQGFYDRSLKTLGKLIEQFSGSMKINEVYVNTLLKSFKLEQVKHHLQLMSTSEMKYKSEFDYLFAKYYFLKKNYLQSQKWFRKSISKDPLRDEVYYDMARLYYRIKKFDRAKNQITIALEIDPTNIVYQVFYSKIIYEMQSPDAALGFLRKLLKRFPDDPHILANIAIMYQRSGQIVAFKRESEKIQSNKRIDKDFYKFLIREAIVEQNEEEVIKYSSSLIKIHPSDLETRMLLAVFFFDSRRLEKALEILDEIKKRLKTYPKLNYYYAKIFFVKGGEENLKTAMEYADKEIEYNPIDEWGYIVKGEIYIKMKNFRKAEQLLRLSIQKNRNSQQALLALAWIKYRNNFIDDALGLYRRAEIVNSNNPIIHRMKGYIFKKKGQGTLAYESFRVYLELNPDARDRKKIESEMRSLR